jgi:hypothetical protein
MHNAAAAQGSLSPFSESSSGKMGVVEDSGTTLDDNRRMLPWLMLA